MFHIGEYVVYRRDICIVDSIIEKYFNNIDYYVLVPINDQSLILKVPISENCDYIRQLISKEEVEKIINGIPKIEALDNSEINDKLVEIEYKKLINNGSYESLIKIIKTTYLRNKERLDNNKKIRGLDDTYFKLAEKYLYNEFSIVLGMNYDDTKKYVLEKVAKLCS